MVRISLFYVGLYTLLILVLGYRVVRVRRSTRIGLGDGGNPLLAQAMRVHANAIENLPMAAILLVLLELSGTSMVLLHGLGATLLISRILHAIGLSGSSGYSTGRFYGTLGTWVVLSVMAVLALVRGAIAFF